MEISRRELLSGLPAAAALPILSAFAADPAVAAIAVPLLASPPVIRHADENGFTVSIRVTALCTGWVEWAQGTERLDQRAYSSNHGLVDTASDSLVIPVRFPAPIPASVPIYYRVVAQPLLYENAYKLSRGEAVNGTIRLLTRPDAEAERVRLVMVNDTHENAETIARLAERIQQLSPAALIWNGDTCNDFDRLDSPTAILLGPGGTGGEAGGWASGRPLLFVPGNHDVRGERARELSKILTPGPEAGHPYNFAYRLGPLAIIGLDTGEDKPDRHPVFAGTAAYEPYRERQAIWLKDALARPEIAAAPFKVAFCHIPLRGLPDSNDGTTLSGYAQWSGQGAKLWLPQLAAAGCRAVLSGHTHSWRVDPPTKEAPVTQIVGGGPKPESATCTIIDAGADALRITIENLDGQELASQEWKRT